MMRIVIDLQGAQTESRYRGVGKYSLSLTKAIVKNACNHEVIVVLNGLLSESIEEIRTELFEVLPQENIRVWYVPGPVKELDTHNSERRVVGEIVREAFIQSLKPDVVLVTSLFEGLGDDAVTSIGAFDKETPVAVILYDLIPLLNPDANFQKNRVYINYYSRKIKSVRKATALLAISESAKLEAIKGLEWDRKAIANVSSGYDETFSKTKLSEDEKNLLLNKYYITQPFVMYTGGADERKNLHRLIEAFSRLPTSIRNRYQLVFVGKMPQDYVADLKSYAKSVGINDALIFTGYVSQQELIKLYNTCDLFVFPSLHEGFGIPPLEAMACGAPVITSDATSLPEVVGNEAAMFDPNSVESISDKIYEVLISESLKNELIQSGLERVKEFSWDKTAKLALQELEKIAKPSTVTDLVGSPVRVSTGIFKPKKLRILVIKLDHMGDLILAIPAIMKLRARYPYAIIDAMVGSWNQAAASSLNVFENIITYDFFAKKSSINPESDKAKMQKILHNVEEYDIAIDFRRQPDTRRLLLQVPASVYVGYETGNILEDERLTHSLPFVADAPFVKTTLNSTSISEQMLCLVDVLPADLNDYIQLPKLIDKKPRNIKNGIAIFPQSGNDVKDWGDENYVELIKLLLDRNDVDEVGLFILNEADGLNFTSIVNNKFKVHQGLSFDNLISVLSDYSLCLANNSFGCHIASYLGLNVVGIYAGHETYEEWSPVFNDASVIYAPIECSPCHIANRSQCTNQFKCMSAITPSLVFEEIQNALYGECGVTRTVQTVDQVWDYTLKAIVNKIPNIPDQQMLILADALAKNRHNTEKKLFVDISELIIHDSKTGIQRVVKNILFEMVKSPPQDYSIELVYATESSNGYLYAKEFSNSFFGLSEDCVMDGEPIDALVGDIFVGLDLHPRVTFKQRRWFREIHHRGVKICFIIYDILPILYPEWWDEEGHAIQAHREWLETIAMVSDKLISISQSVSEEVQTYINENNLQTLKNIEYQYFHLGADIKNSMPSMGVPNHSKEILNKIKNSTSFITVGTLEPRKGHMQLLNAFEDLWAKGEDVSLVIVGKEGWRVNQLINKLQNHPKLNQKLFWLKGISDEFLEELYASSSCLIAASEAEGFGLPLIEAAQHKKPIIARDIPVFREVAGENAFYFPNNNDSSVLAQSIQNWMSMFKEGKQPKSDHMPWMTWKESSKQLMKLLFG